MAKPSLGTSPKEIMDAWKDLNQQQVGRMAVIGEMVPGPKFTWMNMDGKLQLAIAHDPHTVSAATPEEEAEVIDCIAKGQMEIRGHDRATHKNVIFHQASGIPLQPAPSRERRLDSETLSM